MAANCVNRPARLDVDQYFSSIFILFFKRTNQSHWHQIPDCVRIKNHFPHGMRQCLQLFMSSRKQTPNVATDVTAKRLLNVRTNQGALMFFFGENH